MILSLHLYHLIHYLFWPFMISSQKMNEIHTDVSVSDAADTPSAASTHVLHQTHLHKRKQ